MVLEIPPCINSGGRSTVTEAPKTTLYPAGEIPPWEVAASATKGREHRVGGKDTANEIVNFVGEKGDGGGGSYNISVLPTTKKSSTPTRGHRLAPYKWGGLITYLPTVNKGQTSSGKHLH